jgi:hypothetical protein
MPLERREASGDERCLEPIRRLREVVDGAEAAEALPEHAPPVDAQLPPDELGVANDRVGPKVS